MLKLVSAPLHDYCQIPLKTEILCKGVIKGWTYRSWSFIEYGVKLNKGSMENGTLQADILKNLFGRGEKATKRRLEIIEREITEKSREIREICKEWRNG
jgi:hypothetical protein